MYFYADSDASLYDATIRVTQFMYDIMHEAMIDAVCAGLAEERGSAREFCVLDLGCGTGEEALRLLHAFPNCRIIGLDVSEPMLGVFRKKLQREPHAHRVQLVQGDVLSEGASADDLRAILERYGAGRVCDAVVTGFLFHHFKQDELGTLYRALWEVLTPGGVFANADLFDFWGENLSAQALRFGLEYLRRGIRSAERAGDKWIQHVEGGATAFEESWIAHMEHENIPAPLAARSTSSNPRAGMQFTLGTTDLLLGAGFEAVVSPFRYWQAGVVQATKS